MSPILCTYSYHIGFFLRIVNNGGDFVIGLLIDILADLRREVKDKDVFYRTTSS